MTDEKAKEILDFLARRIGYEKFAVDSSGKAGIYSEHAASAARFLLERIDEKLFEFIYVSRSDSYAKILEKIFTITCKGHQIETFFKDIFLKQYATLEQILVEIDMQKSLETCL